MRRRAAVLIVAALVALAATGCGTFYGHFYQAIVEDATHEVGHTWQPMTGTRWEAWIVGEIFESGFDDGGVPLLTVVALDFPFSFTADLLLLPITLPIWAVAMLPGGSSTTPSADDGDSPNTRPEPALSPLPPS